MISHENAAPNIPSYLVYIPDVDGYTEGYSLSDAINMVIDYVSLVATEGKLPESNFVLPTAKKINLSLRLKLIYQKSEKINSNFDLKIKTFFKKSNTHNWLKYFKKPYT